jgi:hypothetical protein
VCVALGWLREGGKREGKGSIKGRGVSKVQGWHHQ